MTLPVPPISATEIMRHAAAPTPDLQALTQRFDQLMSHDIGRPDVVRAAAAPVAPQVSNALHSLDQTNRVLNEDMYRMIVDAPHMDLHTLTAVNMDLTLRTAVSQAQITTCSAVAKSGKDGLSTLMKNQ